MAKNKTFAMALFGLLIFSAMFFVRSLLDSAVNNEKLARNNEARALVDEAPDVDTLDSTISCIAFFKDKGIDTHKIKELVKAELESQYDTAKEGNLLNIYFEKINFLPKKYQFNNRFSGADVQFRPNFDPYEKKYKTIKPNGFTFIITVYIYKPKEKEIADLIYKIVKNYLPQIYNRKLFFKKEKKAPVRSQDKFVFKNPGLRLLIQGFLIISIVSTYPHTDQCRD